MYKLHSNNALKFTSSVEKSKICVIEEIVGIDLKLSGQNLYSACTTMFCYANNYSHIVVYGSNYVWTFSVQSNHDDAIDRSG